MGTKYQQRISDMIRTYLTKLLSRKANDPRLNMVTITDVEVTPDTKRADVYFSILGDEEERAETQAGLDSAAGWLRRELGDRLRLRHTPELLFHYDPSLAYGEHLFGILEGLAPEEREEHDDPDKPVA
jgi:ribosome-binding factor A